jgi:hypothetical protein
VFLVCVCLRDIWTSCLCLRKWELQNKGFMEISLAGKFRKINNIRIPSGVLPTAIDISSKIVQIFNTIEWRYFE